MQQNPLGKSIAWPTSYDPGLLFRIERRRGNNQCQGYDRWTCYELYWNTGSGTPSVGIGEFIVPADSPYIVESKSFKLYLGSFFQTTFASPRELSEAVELDLRALLESEVTFRIFPPDVTTTLVPRDISGESLDTLQVSSVPGLKLESKITVEECLYTNLFRSLCPVTGQPDYASVRINYSGEKICRRSLLTYLVSYKVSQDFHEHCCERIYNDIMERCEPEKLLVECLYTRRGGIDINPLRYSPSSTAGDQAIRTVRQ